MTNLRATTPTPGNPDGVPSVRSGLLAIRVMWAEGLSLPGVAVPAAVQNALSSQQAKIAASVSPSSVTQQRTLAKSKGNRFVSQICQILSQLVAETAFRELSVGGYLISSWNTR